MGPDISPRAISAILVMLACIVGFSRPGDPTPTHTVTELVSVIDIPARPFPMLAQAAPVAVAESLSASESVVPGEPPRVEIVVDKSVQPGAAQELQVVARAAPRPARVVRTVRTAAPAPAPSPASQGTRPLAPPRQAVASKPPPAPRHVQGWVYASCRPPTCVPGPQQQRVQQQQRLPAVFVPIRNFGLSLQQKLALREEPSSRRR